MSPGRDEGEELFDLRADPDELENLVHAPTYQEVRQNLKNEMLHRVMLQDYPLPPRDLFWDLTFFDHFTVGKEKFTDSRMI